MNAGSTKTDEYWAPTRTRPEQIHRDRSGPVALRRLDGISSEEPASDPVADTDLPNGEGWTERPDQWPDQIGRFQILGQLGRGSMGKVFEGYDETLDRKVAVKLLHEGAGGQRRQRLLREAQALARLSHPNVVGVYDAGEHDGQLYVAMELVDGQTLWDWQKTPRPWSDCLRIYMAAGRGLAAAHAQGIVHRDFKPANCILDLEGRVKVLDFGLARGVDEDDDLASEREGSTIEGNATPVLTQAETQAETQAKTQASRSNPELSALLQQLTRTGATLGTPAYMAPEQASGRPTDARGDQFSFCVALYEALYAERPFAGNPGLALAAGQEPSFDAKSPSGLPAVPGWLQAVLRRGLSARRQDRFATMNDLLTTLDRGHRGQQRRRWLGGGLLGVAVLVSVGALAAVRMAPCEGLREAPMAVWGDAQRSAVERSLQASSPENAPGAWEATATELDRQAASWSEARAQACEATRVERIAGEDLLELRMACLDRHAIQVAATVELLTEADGPMAAHAAQMVRSLPEPKQCLNAERLRSTPQLPQSLAPQAEQVRGMVARSWAFDAAGQSLRGLAAAEQAIAQAEALGPEAAPLRAEARLNRGRLYRAVRRLDNARDDLEAVLEHAEQTDDQALALDSLRELLMVAQAQGDPSAFGAWMTIARGKLERSPGDPYTRAQLSYLEGIQALREEQPQRASERLRAAVTGFRSLGSAASLEAGRALLQLAVAQDRLEDRLDADETGSVGDRAEQTLEHAQALAEREGLLPLLADVLLERGRRSFDRGRPDEAEGWLRRSLELRVSFDGPTAPVTIPARVPLAMLLRQRGKHEMALAMVELARRSLGPEVPAHSRVQVMSLLARVHRHNADWESALDAYQGVEEALADKPGADPLEESMLHSNVADCLRMMGHFGAARTRYEQAVEGLRIHASRDDFRTIYPLYGLASLLDTQGDRLGARDLYRRALAIHEAAPRDRDMGAMLRWKLARSILSSPDGSQAEHSQARVHLHAARQQYRELDRPALVAEIDAFIDGCGPRCRVEPVPK
ncbi:MAG: serine/threonine-protein kinase [Myxococcota bacterium]